MPTVSDFKAQAREAEQEGDLAEAIAIYHHVLRHLEQWPDALAEEVALYTRIGDLRVELRQPAQAYAAYRQAAEHYAKLGSADEIKTLCVRMINVVPVSADAYALFARRLLDHGHLDAALDVAREYASKGARKTVTNAVHALTGLSKEETRSLLVDLLETIDRDILDQAAVARRIAEELQAEERTSASRSAPPEASRKPSARFSTASALTKKPAAPVKPESTEGPGTPSSRISTQAAPIAGPRPERRPPATKPQTSGRERKLSVRNWGPVGIGSGIAGVIGVLIIAAVWLGGGDGDGRTSQAMAAMIDTSPGAVDEASGSSTDRDSGATATAPQPQPAPPPVQPDPPEPDPAPVTSSEDTTEPIDVPDAPTTTDTSATATTPIDSSAVITQPLVVGDLAIESIAPIEFRGQNGFRVVHVLDTSGTQFIVESYPVDSASAQRYPMGSVIVNNIPPDTTVSIVRFDERYLVFASGAVPEDSARVLIDLLRLQDPSN